MTVSTISREPGAYPEMPSHDYHALKDVLGSSSIKKWAEKGMTPRAWKFWREQPVTVTDPMKLGDAIHTAILEPEFYESRYAVWTGGRRAGKAWTEFNVAAAGATILTTVQDERARATAAYIKDYAENIYGVLRNGQSEVSYFASDPETGLAVKARADFYGEAGDHRVLVDLKSTSDVTPYARSKALVDKGYAIQLAFYMHVMEQATGQRPTSAFILWVPTTGPIDAVMDRVDPEAIEWGWKRAQAALAGIKECVDSGEFPGMHHAIETLNLPKWALAEEDAA
jgi:exodeoxyribonuclease VIII